MPLFKLAGATGTVTSVGLTAPSSILAVTGSPVTTAGVLALALVAQTANLVWAGPATGLPANPTFRALVAADIPDLSTVYQPLSSKLTAFAALANAAGVLTNNGSGGYSWATAATGTVTSVALTVPSILSVAGSPITTSGTLAVSLATQAANLVFAGPSSGAAATPTFRSLVALDIPDLSATYQPLNTKLTAISALANAAGVLTNNGSGGFSYTTPATGTVTSVSLTVPSFLSVSGSPITTSGTFAVTLATEAANTVFAGPTTGAAAAPTFRTLVAADFPSIPATTFTMATARILGRTTAGTGAVEELTVGTSISIGSGSLNTIQDIRTTAGPTFGTGFQVATNANARTISTIQNTSVLTSARSDLVLDNGTDLGLLIKAGSANTAFGTAGDLMIYNTSVAGAVRIFANSSPVMALFANGNVGIGGNPAVKLDVFTSSNLAARFSSSHASGVYTRWDNPSAATIGLAGAGASVLSGGTATDFAIDASAGNLIFSTGGTERARLTSTNATFSGAVSAKQGIFSGQASGSYAGILSGNSTTGGSFGVFINAGTNASDYSLQILNAAQSKGYLYIRGDGPVSIGSAATSGKLSVYGNANANAGFFEGNSTSGQSYGLHVAAGTNSTDYALRVTNQTQGTDYLKISGNGLSTFGVLVQGNAGFQAPNNVSYYFLDSGGTSRRTALWSSGNNIYYGDIDNSNNSNLLLMAGGSGTINFYVNGANKASIAGNGYLAVVGGISTGNPTGGTAGAWLLGSPVSAAASVVPNFYITISINGTAYKLATMV